MSYSNESAFQGTVIRDLQLAGALVFNVHGHAMQSSGWPDLLIYHSMFPGGCAGLECKMPGGVVKINQLVKIRKLNQRKFRAFILRYWRDGDVTIEAVYPTVQDPAFHQVLLLKRWEQSGSRNGDRERGVGLMEAVNEAWAHEFGVIEAADADTFDDLPYG